LTAAAIDHATAHSRDDADGLEAVAGHYDRMGATLLAAEVLAQASRVHHRAGDLGRWTLTAAKSRQLAAACEGAATPALTIEDPLTALSKREREVATLAAEGLQDRQIALRLALSVRTVESHLSRAYSRLGIAGRDVIEQLLGSSTPTPER
jgi:DNA-binding NarL/FixJ family response regulator